MTERVPGADAEPTGLPPEQLPPVSGPLTGEPAAPVADAEVPPPPRQNVLMREIMRGSVVTGRAFSRWPARRKALTFRG